MEIISEDFSLLNINIVLIILLIALINIVITMKVNHSIRYCVFLIYSSYILCTILCVAAYLTFSWYISIPLGILITDLASKWVKKQLVDAKEEEEKGGFGLTKRIRMQQIENYILNASPADLEKIRKFKEKPITFSRLALCTVTNGIALLIAIAIIVR